MNLNSNNSANLELPGVAQDADAGDGKSELEDYMDDLSDVSSDESIEMSNPFGALEGVETDIDIAAEDNLDETIETNNSTVPKQKLKFYQQDSVVEENDEIDDYINKAENESRASSQDSGAMDTGIAIDTVKKFSGLDKAAVIGINPYVNEDHADFKKFILNLATRAKDNLIIITTSDNIKQKLDTLVQQ